MKSIVTDIKFECLRCSQCCSNLLRETDGILRGLALTPEEIDLFPSEHVLPSISIGAYGRPKKVVAFQMDLNRCPHLEGSSCLIYDKRPIECRIYPFEVKTKNQNQVLIIDNRCKWYRDEIVSKGLRKKLFANHEKVGIPSEINDYLTKRFKFYDEIWKQDFWLFDLNRKTWVKIFKKK